jgi:2'-5' RNA ligase
MRVVMRRLAKTAGWWATNGTQDLPTGHPDKRVIGDGPADIMDAAMADIDMAYRQSYGRPAYPEELAAVWRFTFGPMREDGMDSSVWPENKWVDEAASAAGVGQDVIVNLPPREREDTERLWREMRNSGPRLCGWEDCGGDPGPTDEAWAEWKAHVDATLHFERERAGKVLGKTAQKLLPTEKKPSEVDAKQLAKGIKVEMEHTKDKATAQTIALHHLAEDPKYYDKLETIEKHGGRHGMRLSQAWESTGIPAKGYAKAAKHEWQTGDGTEVGFFFRVPAPASEAFPSLGDEDRSPPHVTFLYAGRVGPEQEELFLETAREALAKWGRPTRARHTGLDYFENPAYGKRVAINRVRFDSDLSQLRWKLRDALQDAGFTVEDKFPLVYQPHTTLEYLDGSDATYKGDVPMAEWMVTEAEVWGLPKKIHKLPLGGEVKTASRYDCRPTGSSLAWISPTGEIHYMKAGQTHWNWASWEGPGRPPEMLDQGWIRVVNALRWNWRRPSVAAKKAALQWMMHCAVRSGWDLEKPMVEVEDHRTLRTFSVADFMRHLGGVQAENKLFQSFEGQGMRLASMYEWRVAMEFATQEALDKYLEDHPKADPKKHKVVETEAPEVPEKVKKRIRTLAQGVRKKADKVVKEWAADVEQIAQFQVDLVRGKFEDPIGGDTDADLREQLKLWVSDGDLEPGTTLQEFKDHIRKEHAEWLQEEADREGLTVEDLKDKKIADAEAALNDVRAVPKGMSKAQKDVLALTRLMEDRDSKEFKEIRDLAASVIGKTLAKKADHFGKEWVYSSDQPVSHQVHGLLSSMGYAGHLSPSDASAQAEEDCDPKCIAEQREKGAKGADLKKLVEATLAVNKAVFDALGVKEITLYRGSTRVQKQGLKPGTELKSKTRELSSWSIDVAEACRFGKPIQITVPVDRILLSPFSSSEVSTEFTVMGSSDFEAKVT